MIDDLEKAVTKVNSGVTGNEKASTQSLENLEPGTRRTTALIVEGGAWAAGVLAFLYKQGRRQYDLVYAPSSGACSAAYFVAGMWEPGLAIWRELASKAVRKTNFLRRKPIIDLAYLEIKSFFAGGAKSRLAIWVLGIFLLTGCAVGVREQRLVSKPNMQFSRSAVFDYSSSRLMPQIQPGVATSGGAQPSTCTICR